MEPHCRTPVVVDTTTKGLVMKLLKKLPDSRRAAPGWEWIILKRLPLILLAGTLIPAALSVANRLFPPAGTAAQIAKYTHSVDIVAIAIAVTILALVFTIAIGCFVVVIMKGPAYVADAYELQDAEHPESR